MMTQLVSSAQCRLAATYLSISLAISPYATLLTPAQPYPLIVGPSRPTEPISGMTLGSYSAWYEEIYIRVMDYRE